MEGKPTNCASVVVRLPFGDWMEALFVVAFAFRVIKV